MILLDTDHISIIQRRTQPALGRLEERLLLSRNLVDFRKVPGLDVEDWTVA